MDSKDLYKRLGLQRGSTITEVKQRFFELSKVNHPDTGGDAENFRKIKESYDILSRVDKKKLYDAGILAPDGQLSRGPVLAKFLFGIAVVCGYIFAIAMVSGMRFREVFALYLAFTFVAASPRIRRSGNRGLIITLFFCFVANAIWAKSVDAKLLNESFLEHSVDLVGPVGVKAKVTVREKNTETFSSEVPMRGIRENVNVPLQFVDSMGKSEVRVQFSDASFGIFRRSASFTVDPQKL